jgi:tRNA(Ile)-lysidine synthase
LIPRLIDEYNPRVREALVRLSRVAAVERHAARARFAALLRELTLAVDQPRGSLTLDRRKLRALSKADRLGVLRNAWSARGWPQSEMSLNRWRRLERFVRSGGWRLDVGAGISAQVTETTLKLIEVPDHKPTRIPTETELPCPGQVDWGPGFLTADSTTAVEFDRSSPAGGLRERIDAAQVELPLSVGPPRKFERFDPLGMNSHTQTLSDFLRGRRVPKVARNRVPVVRDRRGIVWVAGHRIAHRVRLTEASESAILLTWQPDSSPGADGQP